MTRPTRIVLGLALGAASGIAAHVFGAGAPWVQWVGDNIANPAGQIFLRLLLMTVIPLVFTSTTLAVAGWGDIRKVGRVGARTIGYFLVSTAAAAVLGLLLVQVVRPGEGVEPSVRESLMATYRAQAQGIQGGGTRFGLETFINMVPRNPIQAAANLDILGVIVFALAFGAALALIPRDKARPILRVLDALEQAIAKIIDVVMHLAPFGVFALVFVATAQFGWELLRDLGPYVAVVLIGLALHCAIVLSALVRIAGGLSPTVFWGRIGTSIVTAFSTSSSTATLPTNIAVAERELGIPPEIARFVLPLGSTLCANGTALFLAVTVPFLVQVFGMTLNITAQGVVLVLCVLTAAGAAGMPGGALPMLIAVLAAVGIAPAGIAIILGVDRILDMSRTTVNVCAGLSAAVYVARKESAWGAHAVGRPAPPTPAV